MSKLGCLVRLLLLFAIAGGLVFLAARTIALHGNDIAEWTLKAGWVNVTAWLRKASYDLQTLPPFDSIYQRSMLSAAEQATQEKFNLWNWLRNSGPWFKDARAVVTNMDMWLVILILGGVSLLVITIARGNLLNLFSKGKEPLIGAFSTPDKALGSIGYMSFLFLILSVVWEGVFGNGWQHVARSFTQFWWIAGIAVLVWGVVHSKGREIGQILVTGTIIVMLLIFIISMANPNLPVSDTQIKIPLSSIAAFASSLYNGWMETTRVYFWALACGILCFGISPIFKIGGPGPSTNGNGGNSHG